MSLVPGSDVTVPDAPSIRHQTIVLTIGSTPRAHARAHNLGRVFIAPLDVLFSQIDVVEPDAAATRR